MSSSDKNSLTLTKILGAFYVVRIHNIFLIVLAQYLTSIFILSSTESWKIIFDKNKVCDIDYPEDWKEAKIKYAIKYKKK